MASQAPAGGPLTPAAAQEIARVQTRLKMLAPIALALIVVALVAIATARY
jgi:hypothetical protein